MGNVPFCDKRKQTLKATGWCAGNRKGYVPTPAWKRANGENQRTRAEKEQDNVQKKKPFFDLKSRLPEIISGAQLTASAVLVVLNPPSGLLYVNAGTSVARVIGQKYSNKSLTTSLTAAATVFLLIDGALYAYNGYNFPVMLAVVGVAATTPFFAVHDLYTVIKQKVEEASKPSPSAKTPGAAPSLDAEVVTQSRTFFRIMSWMSTDWFLWSLSYSTLVVTTIIGTTMPVSFSVLINAVSTPYGDIRGALWRCSGTLMLITCLTSIQNILFAESSTRLNIRIQKRLMSNLLKQDMEFFDSTSSGEIIAHMAAVGSITGVAEKLTPGLFRAVVTTSTAFYILSGYNIKLAMMCVAAIPLQVALSRWYSRFHRQYSEKLQKIHAKTGRIMSEMIGSVKTIKILSAENEMSDRFWNNVSDLIQLRSDNNWILIGNGIIDVFIPHLTSMLLFLYAGQLSVTGQIDVASLMTIAMYQRQMSHAFHQMGQVYVGWGNMIGSSRACFEYLDRVPKHIDRGSAPAKGIQGAIDFRNVQFGYSNTPNKVLRDFNLSVRPGEVLAIVGPSGGGKSTVIKLLLGLYDPEEGSVLIDGRPVSEYNPKSWHSVGVSVVNQDPTLFSMSFRENIGLGLNNALTQDQIENAAMLANAHDFIIASKEGYDTKVGNRGEKLSGGQKQRTAIARAIVRNPRVLLLDEATSFLDAGSESLVKEAIDRTLKGRTVIIVAHRLSTVQNADRILVVSHGQIVQSGTHKELLADTESTYAQLVQKQLIGGEAHK